MYEFFMWLDSVYTGLDNLGLVILMFLGFVLTGVGLGHLLLWIIQKVFDFFY